MRPLLAVFPVIWRPRGVVLWTDGGSRARCAVSRKRQIVAPSRSPHYYCLHFACVRCMSSNCRIWAEKRRCSGWPPSSTTHARFSASSWPASWSRRSAPTRPSTCLSYSREFVSSSSRGSATPGGCCPLPACKVRTIPACLRNRFIPTSEIYSQEICLFLQKISRHSIRILFIICLSINWRFSYFSTVSKCWDQRREIALTHA